MQRDATQVDVLVVGGGLAGLTAAAFVARAGRSVTVFERGSAAGGRATTHAVDGFLLNQGAHALYNGGAGVKVLAELGVRWSGRVPQGGMFALEAGRLHPLPTGAISLLQTTLLSVRAKLDLAALLARIARIDPTRYQGLSVRQWVDGATSRPDARRLIETLVRLSTYSSAPDQACAMASIRQLQLAVTANVAYLDGGWQSLVDGLSLAATQAGARIETGARVVRIEHRSGRVRGVRLEDGRVVNAQAVVLAVGPGAAAAMVDADASPVLAGHARGCVPVRAACLDVALARHPSGPVKLVLGVDTPMYASVHSLAAQLAPAHGAVVHAIGYLAPGESADAGSMRRDLEALIDRIDPSWRDAVVEARFLPAMTVSNALVSVVAGGLAGRADVTVPEIDGLLLAGDWIGAEGMLADASLASARRAAAAAVRHCQAGALAA